MNKKTKHVLIALVVLMVAIVILQNWATVETRFFFATLALPHAVLLTATFLIGVAVGLLLAGRVKSS
jgi:uncharacterized integral membrane protein